MGYTGTYCEQRVPNPLITSRIGPSDPCSLRPCRNGGTCRPDLSSRMNHTCDCPLGYAGASCQMRKYLHNNNIGIVLRVKVVKSNYNYYSIRIYYQK